MSLSRTRSCHSCHDGSTGVVTRHSLDFHPAIGTRIKLIQPGLDQKVNLTRSESLIVTHSGTSHCLTAVIYRSSILSCLY